MIINEQNISTLFIGFKSHFTRGFESAPSTYQQIAMDVPSNTREEQYGWFGNFPRMREWLGDRVIRNLVAQGFTVRNRKFEDTISVDRDDIADDRFSIFGPYLREMGRMARVHPDELVYGLLANGFSELAYDGQFYFDTDHPVIDENDQEVSVSNFQAGAGPAWYLIDGSRAVKPIIFQTREPYKFQRLDRETDENVFMRDEHLYGIRARVNAGFGLWQLAYASKSALDAANYGAARAAMQKFFGDNGRKLGIMPTLLVVPPDLEQAARQLLGGGSRIEATGAPAGDTTHVSITNEWRDSAQLIVTPYL